MGCMVSMIDAVKKTKILKLQKKWHAEQQNTKENTISEKPNEIPNENKATDSPKNNDEVKDTKEKLLLIN